MSAPPPAPSWPPPPNQYPPAPGYATPVGPPMGPPPGPYWGFRATPVRELLDRIRDGIRWYLVVVALNLVGALASAAIYGYVVGGLFAGGSPNTPATNAVTSGISAAVGLLGLLALVFTIVSWVKWRSGVRELPDSAGEFGTAYAAAALSARKDYGRTVWSFLTIFFATIVFAIAIVVYTVSQVFSRCAGGPANNTSCLTGTGGILGGILGASLAFGLAVALLQFLVYFFSSRSLVDSIRLLSDPTGQQRLDRGRTAILVGAAIEPVGLINLGLTISGHPLGVLAYVGVLTPLLFLYGFYELNGAYTSWLARPMPPSAGPGLGAPYSPPPAQPYAPPAAQPYGAPYPPAGPPPPPRSG